MKLGRIISAVPGNDIVTIEDYLTGKIYVDRKKAYEIIEKNDQQWHQYQGTGLKNFIVYRIEVGKAHGDLIVSILKD